MPHKSSVTRLQLAKICGAVLAFGLASRGKWVALRYNNTNATRLAGTCSASRLLSYRWVKWGLKGFNAENDGATTTASAVVVAGKVRRHQSHRRERRLFGHLWSAANVVQDIDKPQDHLLLRGTILGAAMYIGSTALLLRCVLGLHHPHYLSQPRWYAFAVHRRLDRRDRPPLHMAKAKPLKVEKIVADDEVNRSESRNVRLFHAMGRASRSSEGTMVQGGVT